MPGVKSVTWNEINRAKALDALLFYASIRVDENVAAQVADYVGGGCTPRAIRSLLQVSKRKFKAENGAGSPAGKPASAASTNGNSKAAKPNGVTKSKAGKTGSAKAKGFVKKEPGLDEDSSGSKEAKPITPPETPQKATSGHVRLSEEPNSVDSSPTKRVSPRSATRVDYAKLDSPAPESGFDSDEADKDFDAIEAAAEELANGNGEYEHGEALGADEA